MMWLRNTGLENTTDIWSDVNVQKPNSFLATYYQLVSISKRNETFYASFTVIQRKIKTVLIKNSKKIMKLEQNKMYF
jgi:hypothetical protein